VIEVSVQLVNLVNVLYRLSHATEVLMSSLNDIIYNSTSASVCQQAISFFPRFFEIFL